MIKYSSLAISAGLSYNKLKLSIRLWGSGTLWLQRWNICTVKCGDSEQPRQTRLQEPHKRGCISKRISKNFLEIFLEIAMPYGARIFWGSNKKEPKTLVNTGLSASFIIRYRLLKFLKIRMVIVPWKPFESNLTWVRISHPPPVKAQSEHSVLDLGYFHIKTLINWLGKCSELAYFKWNVIL